MGIIEWWLISHRGQVPSTTWSVWNLREIWSCHTRRCKLYICSIFNKTKNKKKITFSILMSWSWSFTAQSALVRLCWSDHLAFSGQNQLMTNRRYFSYFFSSESRVWHFMKIVSLFYYSDCIYLFTNMIALWSSKCHEIDCFTIRIRTNVAVTFLT